MKNFFKKAKSGFTLVELMIVIAVIGILMVAFSQFNIGGNIAQEKVTRLAEQVYDILRDAKNDMIIGKTASGNVLSGAVEFRRVTISTGGIEVKAKLYNTSSDVFVIEKNFSPNFDSDKKYEISSIKYSTGKISNDQSYKIENFGSMNDATSIVIDFKNDISGSGSAIATNSFSEMKSYLIELKYDGFKRYIYGDVLTGNAFLHTRTENPPTP